MADEHLPILEPVPVGNPNQGIIFIDFHPANWVGAPVQVQVLQLAHELINLISHPGFHMMNGIRVQVKAEGMLVPQEILLHLGNKGTFHRAGKDS